MRVLGLVLALGCLCLAAGCGSSDKVVKVDDGTGADGVVKRDIDAAKSVAGRQSEFQREGEQVLSGQR